eukprot:GDKH01025250.1.p2 GENE.GDKH01025250.1~~GDKH01025250.1.p2  ORF type:complete len:55 (-),score=11.13 GDKH01025250.1:130-294(-)
MASARAWGAVSHAGVAGAADRLGGSALAAADVERDRDRQRPFGVARQLGRTTEH